MFTSVTSDRTHDYLSRIGSFRTLSASEEIELAKQIEVGLLAADRLATGPLMDDGDDLRRLASSGRDAYGQLMCANLKLVVVIAKRYLGHGLALADLIQNGSLGLDRAVKQFDYTRGFRFSTCAVPWIRQAIWQGVANNGRTIRIPVHTLEAIHRIQRTNQRLTIELGRAPSIPELGLETAIEPTELRRLLAAEQLPFSLDIADASADTATLVEQLVDDDSASTVEVVEARMMRDAIRDAVRTLPHRERVVVLLRFGFAGQAPMTLERIGTILGVSKQRIRQIEIGALEHLRTDELATYRYAA